MLFSVLCIHIHLLDKGNNKILNRLCVSQFYVNFAPCIFVRI